MNADSFHYSEHLGIENDALKSFLYVEWRK